MSVAFSPSDLSEWLACTHAAALGLRVKRGEIAHPPLEDAQAALVFRKGNEHEAAYLGDLRARGGSILELAFDHDWDAAARATAAAIRAAEADVLYQACLVDGDWRGFADFLERQPDGTYEVVDTKLARHAKPGHVFQLCFYSSVVGRIQRRDPKRMHLVLGDGRRETFLLADYDAYYRRIRDDFLAFVADDVATAPYPCDHCAICAWRERCENELERADHLSRVAGIRRTHVERLVAAGVPTLEALAGSSRELRVARIPDDTLAGLREQASLQLHHRRTRRHRVVQLPPQERRGFALLPPPAPGDVYYDIEGDPFYSRAGSLEYLHGVTHLDDAGELAYRAFWATDDAAEKDAFEQLVDFLVDRLVSHPGMHVYHYANYERAALQRLMQKHGTREEEVDDLLRGEVLVDLYQVVRQALRISLPSYSLKKVETLYFPERETEVGGGDESTVAFERFLETGDRTLLEGIERYNRDDCDSTFGLHWWLVGLRPDLPWAEPPERREPAAEAEEARTARRAVQERLLARGDRTGWLAANLLDYHRRDAKPAWWDYFRHLRMDERELIEDATAIGGIRPDPEREPYPAKRSLVYSLTFPPQEFKVGRDAIDPFTERDPGTIVEIDEIGRITLRRAKARADEPLPRALVDRGPYRTWEQQDAVLRVASALADGRPEHRAAQDVLTRAAPRARLDATVVEAALSLDDSYLFVQGPPGSGKTYAGAEMAVELMRRGRRVGVAALSHRAIHNFLDHVVRWASAKGVDFTGWKKCTESPSSHYVGLGPIENVAPRDDFVDCDADLVAGTSYLFSYPGVEVDTLFVDEAGQIALADALAMGTAARNIVLLGDPNQLPQVSQGAQPPEVRASVLQHLLHGHGDTIPPHLGVFLESTWRLRPELSAFVSEAFYEGRLRAAGVCALRSVSAGNGLRFASVEHAGNRQSAPEEADWIAREIERLLGATFTDERGVSRPLRHTDVLVVAPYNAQVRCLRGRLPREVRVGTVDKFQGQEAPVVFFSMTSSSGGDVPRGLEFLFSRNRFNVAVSRAQCLAYVVASPALLVTDTRSPEQMRLVNTVCRFAEAAAPAGRA